jgi:large subunit ribosomal protein L22
LFIGSKNFKNASFAKTAVFIVRNSQIPSEIAKKRNINYVDAVDLRSGKSMPKFGYSITELDPERAVKASGRELRISPKHAREVCKTIKGMRLYQAKRYLAQVVAKKQPVPFRRFVKKLGHRHGMQKAMVGKYPVKAATEILRVLESAEGNAEFKGLDVERLRVIHASAYPGFKMKRAIPRAFGRSSPKNKSLTHVEIALEEIEEKAGEAA